MPVFPFFRIFVLLYRPIETSGSRPSGWRTRFRNRWEQSWCGVGTRRGNIVVLGHRWSGTGLERHLATITYRLLSAISAENRFARHVIVAIWSTTSNRHDTRKNPSSLLQERIEFRPPTLSPRDPANFFPLSPFSDYYLRRTEFHSVGKLIFVSKQSFRVTSPIC